MLFMLIFHWLHSFLVQITIHRTELPSKPFKIRSKPNSLLPTYKPPSPCCAITSNQVPPPPRNGSFSKASTPAMNKNCDVDFSIVRKKTLNLTAYQMPSSASSVASRNNLAPATFSKRIRINIQRHTLHQYMYKNCYFQTLIPAFFY